jgi:hypothetical protein
MYRFPHPLLALLSFSSFPLKERAKIKKAMDVENGVLTEEISLVYC